jgi:hypothetical protein
MEGLHLVAQSHEFRSCISRIQERKIMGTLFRLDSISMPLMSMAILLSFDALLESDSFSCLEVKLNAIIELGGVANAVNHSGQTALHKIVSLKFTGTHHDHGLYISESMDFLLQEHFGMNLHARDNKGFMATHFAASVSRIMYGN